MNKKRLDILIRDGWVDTGRKIEGRFPIYERGNERLAYNPQTDQILSYEFVDVSKEVRRKNE